MFLPLTTPLSIRSVADRGVPNSERILIYSLGSINLQNFIVGIGYTGDNQLVTPIPGYVYYFDDIVVPEFSWIVIYTGPGQKQVSKLPSTGEIAFTYHWGSPNVLFQQPGIVPILFRISELNFPPEAPPALKASESNRPALTAGTT
jgi:hypothetical protein